MSKWATLKEELKQRAKASDKVYMLLLAMGLIFAGLTSTVSATVNLSALIDFADAILDNQDTWISLIVFGVIIVVVHKFGTFMSSILNMKAK